MNRGGTVIRTLDIEVGCSLMLCVQFGTDTGVIWLQVLFFQARKVALNGPGERGCQRRVYPVIRGVV